MGIAICGTECSPSTGCQDFMKLLLRSGLPSDTSFGCSNGSDYNWKPHALSWLRLSQGAQNHSQTAQMPRCLGFILLLLNTSK